MLIDAEDIIRRQRTAVEAGTVVFDDGSQTMLTPVQPVPPLADKGMSLSLNGEWAVTKWPFSKKESVLAAPRTRTASWDTVPQPGPVFIYDPEVRKADVENYDRVKLTHVHPEDGAVVRRAVRLPASWRGKRITLHFGAIYPAGRIYVNGRLVGEHLSGLTPVDYDVTDLVEPGKDAVVAVRLLRRHPFIQLDMPRHAIEFTGLSQDACFHATGKVRIGDYQLVADLDPKRRSGALTGSVRIDNGGARASLVTLDVRVVAPDGKRAAGAKRKLTIKAGEAGTVPVSLALPEVLPWNDENPHLYDVALALTVDGHAAGTVAYRAGFRHLALSPKGAFLNGNRVKFRGVNHLTFHPDHGMYTPEPWLRRNFELMKKANVNAIRTHFLAPPAVADLCDELGLYLLQELPVDWGTHYIHDPAWIGPALMRLEGGVRRDRHHPSVMVWSVGNENMPETREVAPAGWHHLRLFERFVKALDPSRHTMFPPPGPANKVRYIVELRVGDIADTHYSFEGMEVLGRTGKIRSPLAWDGAMETITREDALKRGWKGVWFSSEYGIFNMQPDLLHAPYLSVISDVEEDILSGKNTQQVFFERLKREWGLMRNDPTCLGGAYFPWLCSGRGAPGANPWGWVRWGEDADWGVVTADLLPKPHFWVLRNLFAPVRFAPDRVTWKPGQRHIELGVTNLYNAIDLADCTVRTLIGGGGKWMGHLSDYRDVPLSCRPGRTKRVRIPIWNQAALDGLKQGAPVCCRCVVLDPKGFRTLTQDILVVPEALSDAHTAMPMGPDAIEEW